MTQKRVLDSFSGALRPPWVPFRIGLTSGLRRPGAACSSPTVLTGTFGNGDLTTSAPPLRVNFCGAGQMIFKSAASAGICAVTGGTTLNVQVVSRYRMICTFCEYTADDDWPGAPLCSVCIARILVESACN